MIKKDVANFFAQLDCLPDRERSALKQEAGIMLHQAKGNAMLAFYKCLPDSVPESCQDRYFAAACIHCLWNTGMRERQPLEEILYTLGRQGKVSDSTVHRLEMILDLNWDDDGFLLEKLTQLIRWAKMNGCAVNCAALLIDLMDWDRDDHMVQLKLAKSLY